MTTKVRLAAKIDEIVQPYCKCKWCLLKEALLCDHHDIRFYTQLKCVEIYKLYLSEKAQNDVGWEAAWMSWAELGYASLFAKYYNEDISADDIYNKIVADKRKVK